MYYYIMYLVLCIYFNVIFNFVGNLYGIFMFCFQLIELQMILCDCEVIIQEMIIYNESLEIKVERLLCIVDSILKFMLCKLREIMQELKFFVWFYVNVLLDN